MIKHLREQQARLEVEAEAASVLRIKQKRLEETIKSMHKELKEAKKSHTPVSMVYVETEKRLLKQSLSYPKPEAPLNTFTCLVPNFVGSFVSVPSVVRHGSAMNMFFIVSGHCIFYFQK